MHYIKRTMLWMLGAVIVETLRGCYYRYRKIIFPIFMHVNVINFMWSTHNVRDLARSCQQAL